MEEKMPVGIFSFFAYNESSEMKEDMRMRMNERIEVDSPQRDRPSDHDHDRDAAESILTTGGRCASDRGGEVLVLKSIGRLACHSAEKRASVWHGTYMQMVMISVPRGESVGAEVHTDADQYVRVEQGNAIVAVGLAEDALDTTYRLHSGDAVFVPACTWHNIINSGRGALKLTSTYAPPQNRKCPTQEG